MSEILTDAIPALLLLAAEAKAIASNETLVVYFAGGETHYEGGLTWFSAPQAMGYRYAVLESSALGYGIYQHIGFRELCKVANYLMDAASA